MTAAGLVSRMKELRCIPRAPATSRSATAFYIVALAVIVMLGFRIGAELVVSFVSERQASADSLKWLVGAGASCPEESLLNNYLALCPSSVERHA